MSPSCYSPHAPPLVIPDIFYRESIHPFLSCPTFVIGHLSWIHFGWIPAYRWRGWRTGGMDECDKPANRSDQGLVGYNNEWKNVSSPFHFADT